MGGGAVEFLPSMFLFVMEGQKKRHLNGHWTIASLEHPLPPPPTTELSYSYGVTESRLTHVLAVTPPQY